MALLQRAVKPPKTLTSLQTDPLSAVRAHALACPLKWLTLQHCCILQMLHYLVQMTADGREFYHEFANLCKHAQNRDLCRCRGVMASSFG